MLILGKFTASLPESRRSPPAAEGRVPPMVDGADRSGSDRPIPVLEHITTIALKRPFADWRKLA